MIALALVSVLSISRIQDDVPLLGTNLAPISPTSTQRPFNNIVKTSLGWNVTSSPNLVQIDSEGQIISSKTGGVAELKLHFGPQDVSGDYQLSWLGDGELAVTGAKLESTSPGRAVLSVQCPTDVTLSVRNIGSSGFKNFECLLPGVKLEPDSSQFDPVFLQRMSLYRVIRFKNWWTPSASQKLEWNDRPQPSSLSFAKSGVPIETMLELCNIKNISPWLNIPYQASENFVRELVDLCQKMLKPNLKIYVEYSDRCWISGFPQTAYCENSGKAKGLDSDIRKAGMLEYVERSTGIFKQFTTGLKDPTRVVKVLSVPIERPELANQMLDYKNASLQSDAIAVEVYFGAKESKFDPIDALLKSLSDNLTKDLENQLAPISKIARSHRLKLFAFEGGQHLTSSLTPDFEKIAEANRSEAMGQLYSSMLKTWLENRGELFIHTMDCSNPGQGSAWGTIEYQNQDPQSSPKNTALIKYALFPERFQQ